MCLTPFFPTSPSARQARRGSPGPISLHCGVLGRCDHRQDAARDRDELDKAAARIFGYTADDVIGKPIGFLIPQDRVDEESQIIERVKQGEHVTHFETVR